jgi:hypothetical protein
MTKTPSIASVSTIQQRIAEAKKPYRAPKPDRPTCAFVLGKAGVKIAVMSDDGPTPERVLHSQEIDPKTGEVYGGVTTEKTMVEGEVRHPKKVVGSIQRMHDKGLIDHEAKRAAESFRNDFEMAALDPLRAANIERVSGGKAVEKSSKQANASDRVAAAMKALGGWNSAPAQAAWWVLGADLSINEFRRRMSWGSGGQIRHETATSLVAEAAKILATQA